MSVGIFYGTSTGITEEVAEILCEKLDDATMYDVVDGIDEMEDYDFLVLCASTWGIGDIQEDWMDVIEDLPVLKGKKVALLGTGDAVAYGDTFVDGLKFLYDKCIEKGAEVVGFVSTEDYVFEDSLAIENDMFLGLAIDHMNEPERTDERIENWLKDIEQYID